MDFVNDSFDSGKKLRMLNIVDDYRREPLTVDVDLSLPSQRVIRSLEQVIEWRENRKEYDVIMALSISVSQCEDGLLKRTRLR
jgi:hypothetical protein